MKDEKTGKFIQSNVWGEKTLRSMKLTDECWDNLDKIAKSKGINRSELIEQLSRELLSQDNTPEKVESFIEKKKANYGNNPSQRGKEFSRDSRDWRIFNEFMEWLGL
jgi:macrodomain Ter protein organizer (MatP/YcbG family)